MMKIFVSGDVPALPQGDSGTPEPFMAFRIFELSWLEPMEVWRWMCLALDVVSFQGRRIGLGQLNWTPYFRFGRLTRYATIRNTQ